MHTITLEVKDSMYEHFLYVLKNLNPQEITVVEETISKPKISLKHDISKLFESLDVTAFKNIDDPIAWQKQQRDEW